MPDAAFRFFAPATAARVDRLVADVAGCGRRQVRRWFADGRVRVDGHFAHPSDLALPGSEISVDRRGEAPPEATFPKIRVVIETAARVVLSKPAGLHCERGRSPGSVAEALEDRYGDLTTVGERPEEAGLVHRLDRDTSGVLLAARSANEYRRLRNEFRLGKSTKQYLALVPGHLKRSLEVDSPLARRAAHMTIAGRHDDALPATTRLDPLDGGDNWTLVRATMRTGVTHQVRVHAAHAGHPLFGDSLYGGPALEGSRRRGQLLHALRLVIDGDLDVTVGPPDDFLAAYALLRTSAS